MPYIQTIQAPNSKVRKELYQLSMDAYDDVEWVKVIKSVYLRMKEERYEEFEQECAERARKFLHTEISIRYQIPLEEVEAQLEKF